MKLKGWLFSALVAGGVVFGLRGGCVNNSAPDEELADHFDELCDIASHNIDTPKKGVTKLGRYMARHLDDMMSDFGATIITIEKIQDDEKHDARAHLARERIQKPWRACQRDWERFWIAVEQDPDAAEIVNRAGERLGRTFEIIFSSKDGVDLKTLPEKILERI